MVAVAASPTPGASTTSPFRSHDHPPYKDMILSALEALKANKATSRQAISKYISDNYSDLPPTHSSLLSHQLRRLQSSGVVRMFKHSYKLADATAPDVGVRKRGRPRKIPFPPVSDHAPKTRGRGRPPKPKSPDFVDAAAVYILPQAEQLKSGFLQSLPGAVAIVLPEGLLSKKTAKSPVLILPNGVQSLVDASVGKKKLGRPRKKVEEEKLVEKRNVGLPRRKFMLPKQVLFHNGEHVSVGGKKLGRPRKIKENGDSKTLDLEELGDAKADEVISEKAGEAAENVVVPVVPVLKKRLVGRPRKIAVVEAPISHLATAIAS